MPQNISMRGHWGIAKTDPKLGKSDLINFGNLIELLWLMVEGGNRNREKRVLFQGKL